MSNQIKIKELSNNRYMINDETIIYAPNIETALTRYKESLIYKQYIKSISNKLKKSDNSEEHY